MTKLIILTVLILSFIVPFDISAQKSESSIQIVTQFEWDRNLLNTGLLSIPYTNELLFVNNDDDDLSILVLNLANGEKREIISVETLASAGITGSQSFSMSFDGELYWAYAQRNSVAISFGIDEGINQVYDLSHLRTSGTTRFILDEYNTLLFSLSREESAHLFSQSRLLQDESGKLQDHNIINKFKISDFSDFENAEQQPLIKRSPVMTHDGNYGYAGFRYSSQVFKFSLRGNDAKSEYLLEDYYGTGFPTITTPRIVRNPDGTERQMFIPMVDNQTPYIINMATGNGRLYVITNGLSLTNRLRSLSPYRRSIGMEPDTNILENSGETLLVYDTEINELLFKIDLPFTAFGVIACEDYLAFPALFNGDAKLIKTSKP